MHYDIEADWLLLSTCNFRCSYCFSPTSASGAKIKTYGTPAHWKDVFGATGKTWLLHITGGEPSIYPDFVELCDQLSQDHYLSINSNLTHPSIKAFARRINPERIHFINAAIHYEMRKKRGAFKAFIEHVQELQDAKFNVLLSLVMTHYVVRNFPQMYQELEAYGLHAIPKVIRGINEGKSFPESYSADEKRLIHDYILQAEKEYKTVLKNMGEQPSINMFSDHHFLDGIEDYRGRMCSAGFKFVVIAPNGTVFRCGPPDVYGNILFRNVRLLDAPKICDTSSCPYFCEKYSVQESKFQAPPSLRGPKVRPTPSKYMYLKGLTRKSYYFLRTDGLGAIIKKAVSKLKRIAAKLTHPGGWPQGAPSRWAVRWAGGPARSPARGRGNPEQARPTPAREGWGDVAASPPEGYPVGITHG